MFNKSKDNKELKVKKNKPKLQITKNEKILLGIIATGVVGYCSYTFVFEPLNDKIKPLEQEVQSLEASVNGRKNIDAQLEETRNILRNKEIDYKKAVVKVPETDRYPELSRNLHTIGFNNNIKISSVTFGQPVAISTGEGAPANAEGSEVNAENEKEYNDLRAAKNGFFKCTVTVNYEGSFMHVMNFVKAMEKQEQILELTNISISEQEKKEVIDNTKAVEDLKEDIETSAKRIEEIKKKIERLMEEKQNATDAMVKAEIQDEIQTQQIERMAEQATKESLENALKDLQNTEATGKAYSVTGGTVTFEYYTKGEV
ncbi:MAG: hypothetical protein ACRDDY_02980, partial [Clostridium sp.]|uniref:hypothetical protein n=1 Tax=Clostridium sp. TaxID=1506 RepID=UPI003EE65D0F